MVRFGIVVWKTPQIGPCSYDMIRNLAMVGERLGFESFWFADHLVAATPTDPYYECYTILSALASETKRIRLGPLVTCVSYRHPSVLAKITATLDVISRGRLEFALGAGWDQAEYNAYGISFPPAPVRVEQVEETLQIITKMWTETEPSFDGKYFAIKKAVNEPKPVQNPHPPIWLGARGSRMLWLVAKYADGWNLDTAFTPCIYRKKLNTLTKHCESLGRDVRSIRKSVAHEIVIGKTDDEVKQLVNRCSARYNVGREDYLNETLVGTPGRIAEKLRGYVELGVDLVICSFVDWQSLKPIELFSEKVVPNI
jgi:F420-dependent oxidoreductase-like protein